MIINQSQSSPDRSRRIDKSAVLRGMWPSRESVLAGVALIFSVLGLLMALFGGVPRGTDPTTTFAVFTIQIVLQAIILWYLYRPNVKEAFGRGGTGTGMAGV
jgi:uncharacterized membrane protein YsdA (DUF1294 family)